jgi:hypothetical protein
MINNFDDFNLSKEILKAILEMGFEEPSPIQKQAIPTMLNGEDVVGQAQTGTGKTAAFGIPIVERVNRNLKEVQCMVLCPTRELSIQVAGEISNLSKYKKISVVPIYGGQPIERQIRFLKNGVQVVVGTPGRVIDHIKRKTLKTENIKTFVLDEADEMFDMGFREDIEKVISFLPYERQTTFFSATMNPEMMDFAARYQKEPRFIKVVPKELTVPKVTQYYFALKNNMKLEILSRILDVQNPKLTVVFCNTKKMVDELTAGLQSRGYFADSLHGDLKQIQRDGVMNKFRNSTIDILVATDVAARGIDVDDVDLVINYDMPQDVEYYVHRIGRTARAGREGTAISFVSPREMNTLSEIQKYTKTKIEKRDMPTLKDLIKRHEERFVEEIKEKIENDDLKKEVNLINVLMSEDISPVDIAAALLKYYNENNKLNNHEKLIDVDIKRNKKTSNKDSNIEFSKNKKSKLNVKNSSRMYINIGSRKGVSQKHIVCALCKDANIDSKDIGDIEIFDKFSFVNISKNKIKEAINRLNGKHIKGFKVLVEIANEKQDSLKKQSKDKKHKKDNKKRK